MSQAEPKQLTTQEYHAFIASLHEATGTSPQAEPTGPEPRRVSAFEPRDLGHKWAAAMTAHRRIDDYSDAELEQELVRRFVRRHKDVILSELGPELARVFALRSAS